MVFGHLTLAVIDRNLDGSLRGANLLELHPQLSWLTALAPMPVFFCAAGWANSTTTTASAAGRLRTLVGLGAVVVTLWSTAAIVELLVLRHGSIVADGARIATQPLWFLAAYVPFTAAGAHLSKLATRPVMAVGACLAVLAGLDVARFALGAPTALGWPGFVAAWVVPWLLGAWWRHRGASHSINEVRVGTAFVITAVVCAALLVRFAGYSPALIDAVKGRRSNTTPPTLYTAVAALAQVGALMMVAATLDRIGTRFKQLLDRAGQASVGVYLWHLSALSICAALLAAGLWTPDRFSLAWWLSRPLWLAGVLAVTVLLVSVTNIARRAINGRGIGHHRATTGGNTLWLGVALSTLGAAVVGVAGPRTLPAAVVGIVSFVGGWLLLASPRLRQRPT